MNKSCNVCDINESKYKCPNCEIPYCSLDCYKTHKKDETACAKISNSGEDNIAEHLKAPLLFTTMDTVRTEDLEKLRNNESLKNILYNPHLRTLLKELDSSPNSAKAIRVAMMEPIFLEFSNECLKILEKHEVELN